MTPGTCGAVGERAQVILVWVRALSVGNASHPRRLRIIRIRPSVMSSLCVAYGMSILECSRTPQSEVRARRCDNVNGALPKDNALEQQ